MVKTAKVVHLRAHLNALVRRLEQCINKLAWIIVGAYEPC